MKLIQQILLGEHNININQHSKCCFPEFYYQRKDIFRFCFREKQLKVFVERHRKDRNKFHSCMLPNVYLQNAWLYNTNNNFSAAVCRAMSVQGTTIAQSRVTLIC